MNHGSRRVTLKQIAEAVGISVATVSHILGSRGSLYRPETRDRVLRVASELGYRPNAFARAVRRGKFGSVSLLLSSNPDHSELFGPLAAGIHEALDAHDLHLSLDMLSDAQLTDPTFVPRFLRVRMVDGLLIAYYHGIPPRFQELIRRYRIPSVWINSRQKNDCVYADDWNASRQAAEHLIQRGRTRIAFVDYTAPVESGGMLSRYHGYAEAVKSAGLKPLKIGKAAYIPRSERIAFSRSWLDDPGRPDGVVCLAESTALPLMEAAAQLGISIPGQFSVVTFANRPADLTGVHVTTWQVPFHDIGRNAVAMLTRKLEQPRHPQAPEILPFTFDQGETS